ncbi:glycosyltransferase [Asticcacaulis sp. ZE23SCel15]|uniref:glycosyltransferase n=1 Tax=Asticcacaulis sp. ZE23SCel15 TaxID=3059027 RepID=UPI00265EDCB8|nr:glycosyltransferase [Asticcacaulis sp. ZE23SCel15]WKL56828.1 glycosyltransferase [Asticcacaulis sp. ZE23SCel15]
MISVVIPTLNAEDSLVRTLSALVPGVVEGLIKDVIIVDGGSEDATLEIAESTGCRILHADASRGLQLWQGCREARGDWLLILHADSQLGEGWMDQIHLHMRQYPQRAGYFRLTFDDPSWLAAFWAEALAFRARWFGAPSGDHGLFMSRALYDAVGGYKDQAAYEALSMDLALGRARLRPIPTPLITSGERFKRKGWAFSQIGKGWSFIAYLMGFPPKPPKRT